jgi:creatinine amidohydrolase/Fe(II)-dependent formamide hydrolase-like protein
MSESYPCWKCGGLLQELLLPLARHEECPHCRAQLPAMATSGPFSRSNTDNPRAGIWGDPTLASEDKGHRLLAAMVDDLLAVVEVLQGEQD